MKGKILIVGIAVLLFISEDSFAQTDTCKITVGTCLGQLNAWSREVPFVDLMKTCLVWRTQPSASVTDSIPMDADGYPLQIPYTVNGVPQTMYTQMIYGQKPFVLYPGGTYVVLYEGTGTFQFLGDAVISNQTPGRIELTVTPSTGGIWMNLLSSDLNDHLHNIRVLMPGTEFTYQQQPFTQEFLNYLAPFKVIRPMWWQFAWRSGEGLWGNRRTTSYYRQSSYFSEAVPRGCAYEYLIKLCNMTNKDLWLCVPHAADSEYVMNLARMMRDSLNPNLKIYLEYSNELWNYTNTVAFPWVQNNAPQSLNSAQRIAYFYKRNFDWWQSVFGSQMPSRVIRVVGCQLTNPWFAQQEMAYLVSQGSGADALSPADYFLTLRPPQYPTLDTSGASATAAQVINLAKQNIPGLRSMCIQNDQVAQQYGLRYIFYEGGQDLDPQGYAPHPYNPAIYNAQLDTAMYSAYMDEFKFLRDSTTLDLFMHFVLFSDRGEFQNGPPPWGALESVFQDTAVNQSVKFRALIDNINYCASPNSILLNVSDNWNLLSVPMQVQDRHTSTLFPSAISNAYAYHGDYVPAETLESGKGYWLKFNGEQNVSITGLSQTRDSISVYQGWNLVGSISLPIPASSIISIPGGMIVSNFFEYQGSYVVADTIQPGRGYWVKVNQSGTLVLASTNSLFPKARVRIVPDGVPPPSLPDEEIVNLKPGIPHQFLLKQNYPNPFNPSTILQYELPTESRVRMRIYNVLGQLIRTMRDHIESPGYRSLEWNSTNDAGTPVPSGIYVCRLEATSTSSPSTSFIQIKKLILIR